MDEETDRRISGYLELGKSSFQAASVEDREEALIHATEFLNCLPYRGEPASSEQSLAWPRKGIYRDDGEPVKGFRMKLKR